MFKILFSSPLRSGPWDHPQTPTSCCGCQRTGKDGLPHCISHENLPICFLTLYLSSWPLFYLFWINFHPVPLVILMSVSQYPVLYLMLCGQRGSEHRKLTYSLGRFSRERQNFLRGQRGCPQGSSDDLEVITPCSVSSQKDSLQRSSELIGGIFSCPKVWSKDEPGSRSVLRGNDPPRFDWLFRRIIFWTCPSLCFIVKLLLQKCHSGSRSLQTFWSLLQKALFGKVCFGNPQR